MQTIITHRTANGKSTAWDYGIKKNSLFVQMLQQTRRFRQKLEEKIHTYKNNQSVYRDSSDQ